MCVHVCSCVWWVPKCVSQVILTTAFHVAMKNTLKMGSHFIPLSVISHYTTTMLTRTRSDPGSGNLCMHVSMHVLDSSASGENSPLTILCASEVLNAYTVLASLLLINFYIMYLIRNIISYVSRCKVTAISGHVSCVGCTIRYKNLTLIHKNVLLSFMHIMCVIVIFH